MRDATPTVNPAARFAAAVLDVVFPPRCLSCRDLVEPGRTLCGPCADTLLELPPGSCPLCAEPPPEATVGDGERCSICRSRPPTYERAFAPYLFGAALADAIHRFKYEDRPHYARPLAVLLAPAVADEVAWADVIAPVPLHPRRLRQRRYDQAWLLAKEVAAAHGRRAGARLLRRSRYTEAQVGRDRAARRANVDGAFEASAEVAGKRVLLVDDVITTGSTLEAAAAAARARGAIAVRGVALARALGT